MHLIDTDGKGVSGATKNGLIVNKREYPVDIIIFGTGYKAPSHGLGSPATKTGIEIIGRNGLSLDKKWQTKGATTFHGYATSGFPNLFFAGTNQGTLGATTILTLDIAAKHVIYMINQAEKRATSSNANNHQRQRPIIEVLPKAEEAHTSEILKRAPFYSSLGGCTPSLFNAYGEGSLVSDPVEKIKRAKGSNWSEGTASFLKYIGDWELEGSLDGLEVSLVDNYVSSTSSTSTSNGFYSTSKL